MTPPTRFRFLVGTLNGIISPKITGKCQGNWYLIPFSEPGRFRYLIGGVMTPPYENIPSNYNFTSYAVSR